MHINIKLDNINYTLKFRSNCVNKIGCIFCNMNQVFAYHITNGITILCYYNISPPKCLRFKYAPEEKFLTKIGSPQETAIEPVEFRMFGQPLQDAAFVLGIQLWQNEVENLFEIECPHVTYRFRTQVFQFYARQRTAQNVTTRTVIQRKLDCGNDIGALLYFVEKDECFALDERYGVIVEMQRICLYCSSPSSLNNFTVSVGLNEIDLDKTSFRTTESNKSC